MKKTYLLLVVSLIIFSCGGKEEESEEIDLIENTAPSIPSLVYPLNNEFCADNNVLFDWNESTDNEGNAITYKVEISDDISFSTLLKNDNSFVASRLINLDKGKLYYWRVKAVDSRDAESPYSDVAQFVTEGEGVSNHVPFAPNLEAPELNSEIAGTSTTLSWSSTDVDGDNLTYDVYLDTNENPTTLVSENQSDNTYGANSLKAASTYYFKIVVKDGNGGNSIGQIWSFKTK